MQTNDFYDFKELWNTYSEVINPTSKPSDKAIAIVFEKLMSYEITDIAAALDRVVTTDVFALKLSDVLNELKGGNKIDFEARGNMAFNNLVAIVSNKGIYNSYIFEDPVIGVVMNVLGWDLDYVNTENCDDIFARKEFVKFYVNEAMNGQKSQFKEIRSACSGINCLLVSADKVRYGTPVTWTLSEADKEAILLGNDESDNVVKRITAELPVIPRLPEEKKADTSVPAPIKDQMAALEQTFESFGV